MEKNNLLIAPSQPLQPHMEEHSKKELRVFYQGSKKVTPL